MQRGSENIYLSALWNLICNAWGVSTRETDASTQQLWQLRFHCCLNAHPPSLPYMIIWDPWPLFNSVNMTVFIQQICSRRVGSTCSEQADAGKLSPPAWFKETFTVSISPPPLLHPHLISYIKCFTFSVWKLSGYLSSSCSFTSASCLRWIGSRCTLVGFWPHKWDCTRVIFW